MQGSAALAAPLSTQSLAPSRRPPSTNFVGAVRYRKVFVGECGSTSRLPGGSTSMQNSNPQQSDSRLSPVSKNRIRSVKLATFEEPDKKLAVVPKI